MTQHIIGEDVRSLNLKLLNDFFNAEASNELLLIGLQLTHWMPLEKL